MRRRNVCLRNAPGALDVMARPIKADKWLPATETQKQMLPKYRGMTPERRMEEAVQLCLDDPTMTVSQAARNCGVARQKLSPKLAERRQVLADQEERSRLARSERVGNLDSTSPNPSLDEEPFEAAQRRFYEPVHELRRVPPIGEFVRKYFSGLQCPDCDKHHEIPPVHDQIMSTMVDPAVKRLLVNVPPYHSKSTNGTVFTTVYELCRDPNSRTGIISKSHNMAERFVRQIAEFLSNPDLYEKSAGNLIDDWGPFTTGDLPWSKNGFFITGRNSPEKEPSVSGYGIGTQIYGTRFDRIICDDVADLKNQKNPDLVAEMLIQITQEFQSRVGRSGKLMILGTRVSPGDIYSYLKDLPGYEIIRHPCIIDEYAGLTLWPDHFGIEDALLQRNSMSLEQFELVYQNSDMPGFGASFTMEHIEKCRDPERFAGHLPTGVQLVAGIDLAGAGKEAGYTAGVILGVDLATQKYYLVDLFNHKQLKAPQLRDQILDWAEQYPLRELWPEANGLQSQLVQYNQEIMGPLTARNIRVNSTVTTGQNKWDPVFGVESMAVLFQNGNISTPWADQASKRRFKDLEDQLLQFPMGRTDLVMAMWLAYRGCRELLQRSALPAFDPRTSKWPGRIRRRRRVFDSATGTTRAPIEAELEGGELFAARRLEHVERLVNVERPHDGRAAFTKKLRIY